MYIRNGGPILYLHTQNLYLLLNVKKVSLRGLEIKKVFSRCYVEVNYKKSILVQQHSVYGYNNHFLRKKALNLYYYYHYIAIHMAHQSFKINSSIATAHPSSE